MAPTSETLSQTPFEIPVRRDLKWDFSDVEKHVIADDILINYLWMTISLGAPGIEKFFVNALGPLEDQITDDPKLKRDMKNMLVQEMMHSATHAKFNRALEAAGWNIRAIYDEIDEIIAFVDRTYTPKEMVGMVAAGEHMLYSFANVYFDNPEIREAMTPPTRRLFDYHLLEEAEHGAVSHDIYRYFCGDGYWFRLKTALQAVGLVRKLLGRTMKRMIAESDEPIGWRNHLRLWRYLLIEPGLLRLLGARLLQYLNPAYTLQFDPGDEAVFKQYEKDLYATQPRREDGQ